MYEELQSQCKTSPPLFHIMGGEPARGGMNPYQLDFMKTFADRLAPELGRTAIETGAGLSTIWLLTLGFEVHSFVTPIEVVERMRTFLKDYPELDAKWHDYVGYSEETLPEKVLGPDGLKASFVLIDGGHGIQTVFIDFVYLNYALAKGGVMLVDDIQMGSPALLDAMLRQDGNFKFNANSSKLSCFSKRNDHRFLPGAGPQKILLETIKGALPVIKPTPLEEV